jgi:acyl-coenzyme A thioesterase PaaI-like protein
MLASDSRAPIGETLNFHMVEVERGKAVFEGRPDRNVYYQLGAVHGYAATSLDSACDIATYTTAEAELHDGDACLCAKSSSTFLVFDVEPGARGALEAVPPTGGDR